MPPRTYGDSTALQDWSRATSPPSSRVTAPPTFVNALPLLDSAPTSSGSITDVTWPQFVNVLLVHATWGAVLVYWAEVAATFWTVAVPPANSRSTLFPLSDTPSRVAVPPPTRKPTPVLDEIDPPVMAIVPAATCTPARAESATCVPPEIVSVLPVELK